MTAEKTRPYYIQRPFGCHVEAACRKHNFGVILNAVGRLITLCFTISIMLGTYSPAAKSQTTPLVVAHYMPSLASYGTTVAGYKRDIQDAQAAGVDAFVLDEMGWGPDTAKFANFQQLTASIFQAASELGTGFKLFLMSDCQGTSYEAACISSAGTMLTAYANHPNYLKYQGRPMFGGWHSWVEPANGSVDDTYWSAVVSSIVATGLNPFFIPTFGGGNITLANYEAWFTAGTWLPAAVQGIVSIGGRPPAKAIENNASGATTMANHGKYFAAAVNSWHAPIRFLSTGQVTPNMGSIEFNGGEGPSAIWQDLINNVKPKMVVLTSWNDYTESYMGPASQVYLTANNNSTWQVTGDYLFTHAAYTELNKYFIQWYKTGQKPSWPDAMYVFYRNASTRMVASKAPGGTAIGWDVSGNPTLDDLYVTTILTAPATLVVNTGSTVKKVSLPAGINHTRIPFEVGAQKFRLSRGRKTLIQITGANVVSSEPYYYNVNPLSYYGYYTSPHLVFW
jgi:glucan endo-1,3-alpha-glucosidase